MKRRWKPGRLVLYGLLVAASIYFVSAIGQDLYNTFSLRASISTNTQAQKEALSQKEELETTRQNLTNPDYVEYLARGKYLVTKEGEQIFKFPAIDKNED